MKKSGSPLDFLTQAQSDKSTSAAVQAAIEKGAAVTAAEVLKIAKKSGTTMSAIENANPGVDPARLKIGQTINQP